MLDAANAARTQHVDLIVTSELAITGYPPRDLLDRPEFVADALAALAQVVRDTPVPMIVGGVVSASGDPRVAPHSDRISNGAVLAHAGQVLACHRKFLLPNYDVYEEVRQFTPGSEPTVVPFLGERLGISVCEDIWSDSSAWFKRRYQRDPVAEQAALGATVLVNLSASPYDRNKAHSRLAMLSARARRHTLPIIYANQVGGNDALIFDGRSVALNARGETTLQAPGFVETLAVGTWRDGSLHGARAALYDTWEQDVTEALCLGLRDYTRKCGFSRVVLGLSGGIDSALTAALAVRALGADNVIGITMPSRYSSAGAAGDAQALARRLGIRCDELPIEPIFQAFLDTLKIPFAGLPADVTEENLQARIRGTLLMAYSNKLGALLLTTGNKSEVAVGYCTMYGDMNGGLGLLSDLYKTEVYDLSRYLNRASPTAPIPESSITKPPSAELRPDQTDQDSLPPYEVLDQILRGYVDAVESVASLSGRFDPALVRRVVGLVDRSEYKRRQMAPGLRVSRKAFGEGRRMPVAQRSTRSTP